MRGRRRSAPADHQTKAAIDQRKPEVGDRVWCAGRPCVITHINEDGTTGMAYVRLPSPGHAALKASTRRPK